MVTATSFLPTAGARTNVSPTVPGTGETLPLQPALTLLVALLIPCVALLFLLNCVLLIQRFATFNRKKKPSSQRWSGQLEDGQGSAAVEASTVSGDSQASQELRLPSASATSQGLDAVLTLAEAHRFRERPYSRDGLHKPDGTAGDLDVCSLRPAITVTVSRAPTRLPRELSLGGKGMRRMPAWTAGRTSQRTISSSDLEVRASQAPPNTPVTTPAPRVSPAVQHAQKTSTQRKRHGHPILIVSPLDTVHFEHGSSIPQDQTAIPFSANSSSAGPGLDSDFGASAGVSLRILSSDSDSFSYSWVSGLEWDYYDPGYKRRNQRRMQSHQFPILCSKQYWV
ncbi:protein huluwa-like [Ambystoma mexicanum]|uniref:protein huluwa-like n=1 Tax=Ambystoma mexicanum TaxID=8296 RepID=UPI0037E817E7